MGGVSRQRQAAAFPPDRFYCLLDELPLHLIPQRHRHLLQPAADEPLYLNPRCRLTPAERIPDELAEEDELLSAFALQGTIAWVREERSLLPFWIGPELEQIIQNLPNDEPAPSSVPADVRAILAAAKILVPLDRPQSDTQERIANAAKSFQSKGYAPFTELVHPFHVAALRRYYRYLIRSGAIQLGDGQSPLRYRAHNEPVARFFHRQIAAAVSEVACEPLKPSYVYFASYLAGAELKKHLDREQCEFSVTFCLDFSPEPRLATPWPISLETPTGTVTVYQSVGDGLAYRGTRLPHYRAKLGEGQTSTSIFFHYVRQDFSGSLV